MLGGYTALFCRGKGKPRASDSRAEVRLQHLAKLGFGWWAAATRGEHLANGVALLPGVLAGVLRRGGADGGVRRTGPGGAPPADICDMAGSRGAAALPAGIARLTPCAPSAPTLPPASTPSQPSPGSPPPQP